MEKIIRNNDNPKLQPILANWLIWGSEWKNSVSNKWTWNKKPPRQPLFELKKTLNELLLELTNNRCAFCDYFPVVNEAHLKEGLSIEHFYPKSKNKIYAIYAYQWENLFPICQKCNNIKGEEYSCNLLKPDEEHYNFDNYFILEGNGEIAANPRADTENKNRAEETILLYQLNRGELKEERRKKVDFFESMAQLYDLHTLYKIRPLETEPYQFFIKRFMGSNELQDLDKMYNELLNLTTNEQ